MIGSVVDEERREEVRGSVEVGFEIKEVEKVLAGASLIKSGVCLQ